MRFFSLFKREDWKKKVFLETIREILEEKESLTFVKSEVTKDFELIYEEITITKKDN